MELTKTHMYMIAYREIEPVVHSYFTKKEVIADKGEVGEAARRQHTSGERDITDYPLFMTDGEPIAINIHSRNEETGKFEVESRTLGK